MNESLEDLEDAAACAKCGRLAGCCQDYPKCQQTEDNDIEAVKVLFKRATGVDVQVKTHNGEFVITDPDGQEFHTGLVRKN